MSIRNYKKELENGTVSHEITFESLGQMVDQLSKQISRSLTAAQDLEKTPDLKLYRRLTRTIDDSEKKIDEYSKKLNELRQKDAMNQLEGKVSGSLNSCRKQMDRLKEVNKRLEEPHRILEEEEKHREEEEAAERQKTLLQLEAERNLHEAEALEQAAGEIVEGMTTLNDLTNELNTHLDEQHETIGRVEKTTEEAHEEMVAGNSELAEAQEHQKGSSKCLYIILGVVVAAVVVIGVFIYLGIAVF